MKSYKQFLRTLTSLTCLGFLSTAWGATHTWIGGNVDWVDATGNGNWSPSGEPTAADFAIFNTPNTVNLGSNNSVSSITLTGGIHLLTNDHNLSVAGLVDVSSTNTMLTVGGTASSMTMGSMAINAGATVSPTNGVINVTSGSAGALTIGSAGTLSGFGTINLNGLPGAPTALLLNEGTLSALGDSPFIFGAPIARTLTLNAPSGSARVDFDGSSGAGTVNVFRNQTLLCNVTINDAFSGTMNLYQNSTLNIANSWSIDTGTVNIHSGSALLLVSADVSYISGGSLSQSGGSILVADDDGTLQFNAPFNMTGGALVNNGTVIFNNNATIGSAANFTMPTTASSLTVGSGVTATINQPNFNLDGSGVSTNVLTINSGGTLNLALGAGSEKQFDGTINLNGGTLHVTTDTANWTISGPVHVGDSTGTSNLTGDTLTITGSTISVGTGSTLVFGAQTVWTSSGSMAISAGAVARLNGASTFTTPGSFTGAGSFLFAGDANFNTPTLINMPSGTVDLTAATGIFSAAHTITFNDNCTINANTLVSFGNSHVFLGSNDTLNITDPFDVVSLWVHLTDPASEWTLNPSAILNIATLGGNFGGGGIQGSDFLMAGTANIGGNSIWTARTDISGTMNVGAGSSINFRGGNLVNTNRLLGGTLTGSGLARALSNTALVGNGVINLGIDFGATCELRADDGTLTLNGAISGVGILGTADTDGILLIPNVWNTSVASKVQLKGGEIRGALITNGGVGGIVGFGLVSARVNNETLLDANAGNSLVFQTGANNNDWDGGGNAGTLIATANSTLELHDNADFPFLGNMSASAGGTISTVGFAFNFQAASSIQLINGTYLEAFGTNTSFGGNMSVALGADSKLLTAGTSGIFTFLTGSSTTLSGNLQLGGVITMVQTGASFSGAGTLINLAGRTLQPDNLAVMNILLDNRGLLTPAGSGVGRVDLHDFQQSPTGNLAINLNGTSLNQFDRVIINGSALVDGQLTVSLGGGFAPSLGNSFVVLSATGGVAGAFSAVVPPAPVGGLLHFILDPTYNSTNVTLTVTRAYYEIQAGPYPQNFTGSGYELWKTTSGTATITGNSSFTGSTTVFAGMLIVNNQNALGTGGLGLTPGTTVQLGSGLGLAVKLPFLAIAHTGSAFTGKLDLADGRFILQSTGGADKTTKLTDLNNALVAGANGGDWLGNGITSSTAALDASHYGVGLFDNAVLGLASLGGQPMDDNSLLVGIAHLGDANRNAIVDIQDQSIVTNHWQSAQIGWSAGDLNRDGFVDLQDLTLVTNNWQQASVYPVQPALSAQATASSVPEPATLLLLSPWVLLLTRNAKRRRQL